MAMHQANYIPWLGYFYKMLQCDIFIYLDVVQYPRGRNFSARNRIKTPNGPVFLTIPLSIPKGMDKKVSYIEIEFVDEKWKDKHKKSLLLNYKKSPFFDKIFQLYENTIAGKKRLIDVNIGLIETIADYLNISTKRIRLSEILNSYGQKTDLIIDICKRVRSNNYLSGTGGGKEYNDEIKLNKNGIKLIYSDFCHPEYNQLWGDFLPNLSILDLLFNHGKESRNILLGSN
jgi:hypothetical protein